MANDDLSHWSDYWASGYTTSLPQDFPSNYDGEIAAFWNRQFDAVPAGGEVLDACTGNGAVALLAARFAEVSGRNFKVTAVDAARIDPAAVAKRNPAEARRIARISFMGERPFESNALETGRFDLVTSQYGIEYCDWTAAAREVARLLRPGGRFAMVSHVSSSDILETMRAELEEYRLVEELGWPQLAADFAGNRLEVIAFRRAATDVRSRLEAAMGATGGALLRTHLLTLDRALALDDVALGDQREALDAFRLRVQHGRARLDDLLRVNRAIHEQADWRQVFSRHGLRLMEQGEILYQGARRSGACAVFGRPAGSPWAPAGEG